LRALYQRKQGRDLFDLYHALMNHKLATGKITGGFAEYIKRSGHSISKDDYLQNVEQKLEDNEFQGDIVSILRPQIAFDFLDGWKMVRTALIENI
jgi:predicted nucleotidyltransferase component of viral defense system